jgi:hypothetical protein
MSIRRWLALTAGLVLASALLWTVYENTLTPASPVAVGGGSDTAARALRAYGGEAVWRNAHTIESTVTVGGLLFQAKGINIPAHAKFTIDVQRPHTVIDPVDAAGDVGVLDGFSVTIQSRDGRLLQQRADARQHFQNASISIPWDPLNLVYFLSYAFWGYFTLPNQLLSTDIRWTELAGGELQADYGSGLPVHSRIQRFWFDAKSGLLRRNDYEPIAAAVGVKVANVVFEHAIAGGVPYAKKRRVKLTPLQYGWVLPAPDFITIDVESWRLS